MKASVIKYEENEPIVFTAETDDDLTKKVAVFFRKLEDNDLVNIITGDDHNWSITFTEVTEADDWSKGNNEKEK